MLTANLIRTKRDGGVLSEEQWRFLIEGFCSGEVADYQMSAMAMAVFFKGLTRTETADLTRCMVDSGERLPRVTDRPRVDKHSTGGLGDKVSLILASLLACCGVDVPMISGRGLGRTGGTLDKLEAIPGYQTQITTDQSSRVLREVGCFIVGATETIAPADRRLYGLRDVTGTVESVGLITASILSKKLAASLDALVMDVKVGSAGFMPNLESATELAESLKEVGAEAGLPTIPVLTDMDQPLGRAIGNAIEVNESLDVLAGGGPKEVRDLTLRLSAEVLVETRMATDIANAEATLADALDSGGAKERFEKMVHEQGGTLSGHLPLGKQKDYVADQDGWVQSIDCPAIGDAIITMGGGRRTVADVVDPCVGIDLHVRIGDRVERGQPLWTVYESQTKCPPIDPVVLSETEVSPRPLILE
ncbi:thymidine phosphorylase [Rhodopirellula halodulae]|uniref:thymidine phosphorylase n=1 Tax=Rhodopirellula halodulae TaxID=2894198 RepID=UPI001E433BD8|nr:thymidine phosphorylase [Rhodopirellula sp. JC737]MCC9654200.1 thymidine phosphorylase [Rhodopirellula sp. JC737]